MADIDTCMIQKFVPRARQINKFPFDDKEFCPVGLQCFKLPAMERNYYFLPAFLFKPAKQLKLGFINLFTLTSFKIMCNILPNKLNWRCLIHWAQRKKVLRAERVSAFSFFSLLNILKQEIKGYCGRPSSRLLQSSRAEWLLKALPTLFSWRGAAARALLEHRNRRRQLPMLRIHRRSSKAPSNADALSKGLHRRRPARSAPATKGPLRTVASRGRRPFDPPLPNFARLRSQQRNCNPPVCRNAQLTDRKYDSVVTEIPCNLARNYLKF